MQYNSIVCRAWREKMTKRREEFGDKTKRFPAYFESY